MLMGLEADGLIKRTKREITIDDWTSLAKAGDFEPRYLHLTKSRFSRTGSSGMGRPPSRRFSFS